MQYQPEVIPLLAKLPAVDINLNTIQDTPLYLPSSLPPETLNKCSKRLVSMETELRIGQCCDSLIQLCTKLNAQARLLKYKYVHVRHQVPNTRSRNLLNGINKKIEVISSRYRHAFSMLQALGPHGTYGWDSEFLDLRKQDVHGLSQVALPHALTQECAETHQVRTLLNGNVLPEGNQTVSWIWRGSLKGNSEDQDGQNDFSEGLLHLIVCVIFTD